VDILQARLYTRYISTVQKDVRTSMIITTIYTLSSHKIKAKTKSGLNSFKAVNPGKGLAE